ncbi:MAG: hypothetical protein QME79_06485 [Bacillota bacterium]|nr:hypothetical protein [Bacillota bacterium]
MQVIEPVLADRFGGEVQLRYLDAEAPELAAYPDVRLRLATPGVRLPLVVADGRVIAEGQLSAGLITSYLVYGHIPKVPEGHKVSKASPAGEEPNLP